MTVLTLIGLLLVFFGVYYTLFLVRVNSGLSLLHTSPGRPVVSRPRVTIIVAARNEAASIGHCLASIQTQDYPQDLIEVIVVDDGSTDDTRAIVAAIEKSDPRVRLVQTNEHEAGNKPRAIARGVQIATGQVIMLTDADCVVPPTWISAMLRSLSDTVSFVAGPVVEVPSRGLLQNLSRIEFLGLIAVSGGLIRSGLPIFCNGANLAFRRSAFLEVDGYGDSDHFSDDESLMQRIHQRNPGAVSFSSESDSIVTTKSPESLRSFWNQRVRWSSKRGVYENKTILIRLILLYFFFLVLLPAGILAIFFPMILTFVIPVLVAKVSLEWITLWRASRLFRQPFSTLHLLIAELVHVPYIVFAALQGQIGSLRWKGASIRS